MDAKAPIFTKPILIASYQSLECIVKIWLGYGYFGEEYRYHTIHYLIYNNGQNNGQEQKEPT